MTARIDDIKENEIRISVSGGLVQGIQCGKQVVALNPKIVVLDSDTDGQDPDDPRMLEIRDPEDGKCWYCYYLEFADGETPMQDQGQVMENGGVAL